MKQKMAKCMVCDAELEEDDCVYEIMDKETKMFPLCGEHAPVMARFLEGSGLADRTSIPWRDALADKWRRDNLDPEL